jgi:hypothetical protein
VRASIYVARSPPRRGIDVSPDSSPARPLQLIRPGTRGDSPRREGRSTLATAVRGPRHAPAERLDSDGAMNGDPDALLETHKQGLTLGTASYARGGASRRAVAMHDGRVNARITARVVAVDVLAPVHHPSPPRQRAGPPAGSPYGAAGVPRASSRVVGRNGGGAAWRRIVEHRDAGAAGEVDFVADRRRVRRIVLNFVSNAAGSTSPEGAAAVTCGTGTRAPRGRRGCPHRANALSAVRSPEKRCELPGKDVRRRPTRSLPMWWSSLDGELERRAVP